MEQPYPLGDELFPAQQAPIVGLSVEPVRVQEEDAVEIQFRVAGLLSKSEILKLSVHTPRQRSWCLHGYSALLSRVDLCG